jgi:FG-GAP-like repeat
MVRLCLSLVAGLLSVAALAEDFTVHTWEKLTLNELFYSEGANVGDFNKDGTLDVVAGPFWYQGPDFKTKHEYYPPPDGKENKAVDKNTYSTNFSTFTYDFNGDGWTDILIYGFPGEDASIFENPQAKTGPWTRTKVFPAVDNESPQFEDITGDGKPEMIITTGGFMGYAQADWTDYKKPWTFNKISAKGGWQRFTHGLGIGDVNGDGKKDLLDQNGWFEQPATVNKDEAWKFHPQKFGDGGAQMYVYDVDDDGKNDVVTSIAAHGYGLAWYKQGAPNEKGDPVFTENLIQPRDASKSKYGIQFSQLHGVDLVDMDGDGLKDIVTGKRHWAHGPKSDPEPQANPVLYWFKLTRKEGGVEFLPFQIDGDSGVGTQVVAMDVNNDRLPDVVVGSKRGLYVMIHKAQKVSKEEFDKAQPKPVAEAPK